MFAHRLGIYLVLSWYSCATFSSNLAKLIFTSSINFSVTVSRLGMRIFDAGCGGGRNLVYLLQQGFEVFWRRFRSAGRRGVYAVLRHLWRRRFRGQLPPGEHRDDVVSERIRRCRVQQRGPPFARDDDHFRAMLDGTWRNPEIRGAGFFCRLASSIGMETPG
jgi:hypothetical protein